MSGRMMFDWGFAVLVALLVFREMYRSTRQVEPDTCQCGHGRSYHRGGRGGCCDFRGSMQCPCQTFVLDPIKTDAERDAAEAKVNNETFEKGLANAEKKDFFKD